ncbi:MAG: aldo/keto reductase [Myxococcota bacterium]|nr:aldo/keto reductase [Myxococcota bacterium]
MIDLNQPLPLDARPAPLGQSSLVASRIAYGCWRFADGDLSPAVAQEKIEVALESGITLFDHADIYGDGEAEALFGRVLAAQPSLREKMLIASKGGIIIGTPYNSAPAYLRHAVEASLRRLQVDAIDLYQIHRPDFLAHPEEVAACLSALREEGKIREIGVSNYLPSQTSALQRYLDFPLITRQPEFSCWAWGALQDGVLDQAMEKQQTPLAWSPMAGGRLALTPEAAEQAEPSGRLAALLRCLDEIGAAQGQSRSSVALAWILAHPARVIPILGTQRPERIREAWKAFDVKLTRTQWNAILQAAMGAPLP